MDEVLSVDEPVSCVDSTHSHGTRNHWLGLTTEQLAGNRGLKRDLTGSNWLCGQEIIFC